MMLAPLPRSPDAATGCALDTLPRVDRLARLGDTFSREVAPTPLPEVRLLASAPAAAACLGLDPRDLETEAAVATLSGNRLLGGTPARASVYSGHQFGVWAGQLGDGRALLLGDVIGTDGHAWELQLKGAGPTPFSRRADGRAVLRSSIREFLCSEAMHALGVPTTRALALTVSPQPVLRETLETAAVVTRMAPSFLRFGHFEHFAAARQTEPLRVLADFVIDQFHPHARHSDEPYAALLQSVTEATARLMAHWQVLGFCHGVMNTDNMSVLGLTIDYGPFGFLDAFEQDHICNHSDHGGRYAWGQQPEVGRWNCYRLGQALLPLIGTIPQTEAALSGYGAAFEDAWFGLLRAKLGLRETHAADEALVNGLFSALQAGHPDFTLFFRHLSQIRVGDASGDRACRDLFIDRAAFDAWVEDYRARLRAEGQTDDAARAQRMNRVNPRFVLRNHLAEIVIRAARDQDDAGPLKRLQAVLAAPFDEHPGCEDLAALPPDWAQTLEVSCSS